MCIRCMESCVRSNLDALIALLLLSVRPVALLNRSTRQPLDNKWMMSLEVSQMWRKSVWMKLTVEELMTSQMMKVNEFLSHPHSLKVTSATKLSFVIK